MEDPNEYDYILFKYAELIIHERINVPVDPPQEIWTLIVPNSKFGNYILEEDTFSSYKVYCPENPMDLWCDVPRGEGIKVLLKR